MNCIDWYIILCIKCTSDIGSNLNVIYIRYVFRYVHIYINNLYIHCDSEMMADRIYR